MQRYLRRLYVMIHVILAIRDLELITGLCRTLNTGIDHLWIKIAVLNLRNNSRLIFLCGRYAAARLQHPRTGK